MTAHLRKSLILRNSYSHFHPGNGVLKNSDFSGRDNPPLEIFLTKGKVDVSDSSDFEPIYTIQPSFIFIHDRTIPIPSVKIQIIPSKYHRLITIIGFIDTGAQRSMLDPVILPIEYWKTQEEHFKAADGKLFTTKLVTKHPIGI